MTSGSGTAMAGNRQVATAKALRVFVSSRMAELADERVVVKRALTDAGCAPWLYEVDAGARPGSPRDTYLEVLYTSDVYLGLFWKTRGAYTVDEFDAARRSDIACLVYEKTTDEREPSLTEFLEEIGHVEYGVSIRRFSTPAELGELVSADIEQVQKELARVSTAGGRTYTATVHGGRFDRTSEVTPIRRHPLQATNSPRPPDPFVDRIDPVARIERAVIAGERMVGVTGAPGAGKTSVLRELAHRRVVDKEAYPDGLGIHIEGEQWPLAGDLLRALWNELYRLEDQDYVPTDATLRADLGVQRALVFVDDVRLPPDHVERLGARVPQSTFILAATASPPDGQSPLAHVKAVPLAEFESDDDIVTLFGASYGETIPSELAGSVAATCRAAGATPGAITRLANDAWGSGLSLTRWLEERSQASGDDLAAGLERVDEDDRRVLALLAAFGPDLATPSEVLTVLGIGAGGVESLVTSQHIVQRGRDLRLSGAVYTSIREATNVEVLRSDVFEATVTWVDGAPASRIDEARSFLLRILAWGEENERSGAVVMLARALSPRLAVTGAWDSWNSVSRSALVAARAVGDREAEGWALHEAGTREMMLGESRVARRLLRAAQRVRRDLDEPAASAMTKHNMSHVPGFPFLTVATSVFILAILVTTIAVLVQARAVIDFGEVLSGTSGARYQIFSNDSETAAAYRIQISGRQEFCLVADDGLVCASSSEEVPLQESIEGGPDLPNCLVEEVDVTNATIGVRVEPKAECVVAVLFSPRLDDGGSRRSFTGDLLIVGDDGEERVRLTGVGVREPDTDTTSTIQGATTTTAEPNGTSGTTTAPENQAPLARDDGADVAEGGTVDIPVLLNDNDPESADVTIEVVEEPLEGTATVMPEGLVVYSHGGSETEQDSFTYRVSDGELFSETATVTVIITPVNDPPRADDVQVTVDEAGQVRFGLSLSDPDDEELGLDWTSPLVGKLEQVDDTTLLYTHDGSETQADTFDYTVTDDEGAFDFGTVAVKVVPVNDPPVAFDQSITNAGCSQEIVLTGSDAENDTLQFSIDQQPAFGTVVFVENTSSNSATFRYDIFSEGSYNVSFLFRVDDGSATDVAEVEISGVCIL